MMLMLVRLLLTMLMIDYVKIDIRRSIFSKIKRQHPFPKEKSI